MLRRWVTASVARTLSVEHNISVLFGLYQENSPDGEESLPPGVLKRIEFRVDGPATQRMAKRENHIFDLNFLITHSRTEDVYVMDEALDNLRKAVSRDFCIFRIDDDHTTEPFEMIGKLVVSKTVRRPLYTHNFGLLKPNNNLAQGVVQGRYEMYLPAGFE